MIFVPIIEDKGQYHLEDMQVISDITEHDEIWTLLDWRGT